ncbi:MAG: hypothetical protein ACW99G_15310 [Candidatus Thorarchaeota archaeon]
MDQESFYKLPQKKQEEFLKLRIKSTLLGFTSREHGDSNASFAVHPMYKYPTDEYRYYDDSTVEINAIGKHLYKDLAFTCSIADWSNGSYAHDVRYTDVYSVTTRTAKLMHNTLKWIERKNDENARWMFDSGHLITFADFISVVSNTLMTVGGVVRVNDVFVPLSNEDLISHIATQENYYIEKYAEKAEKEVENA